MLFVVSGDMKIIAYTEEDEFLLVAINGKHGNGIYDAQRVSADNLTCSTENRIKI